MHFEINVMQLLLNGISTGVGAAFGTLSTFFVMRYFPKFWEKVELLVKAVAKDATTNEKPKQNTAGMEGKV